MVQGDGVAQGQSGIDSISTSVDFDGEDVLIPDGNFLLALRRRLKSSSAWGGLLAGSWLLGVLMLQLLFGQRLERLQVQRLGRELALNLRLSELILERYPPTLISELTGLDLQIAVIPSGPDRPDQATQQRAEALRLELCSRMNVCPRILPAAPTENIDSPQVWIELVSPLEPVWLRSELPILRSWPPEPTLLALALVGAIVSTGGIYLLLEVKRPLQALEKGLSDVGNATDPARLPAQGAPEVQSITQRFNAMLQRLAINQQERSTMLAGIAHDLRAPITRLRFRLSLQEFGAEQRNQFHGDLQALERITNQFLLFAGEGDRELPVECPVDQWLAEAVAGQPMDQLTLELTSMQATIRPVALSRALSNLIDNALSYGNPPVVIRLTHNNARALIEVWDQGQGIPEDQWQRALQPFQRIDAARGQQGHCGLGLAIVSQVMHQHDGTVSFQQGDGCPGRFAVILDLPVDGTKKPDFLQKT